MSISTPVLHGPVLEDRAGAGCGQEIPRQAPGAAGEVAHGTAEMRSWRDVAGAAASPPRCCWPGRWPGGGDTTGCSQVQCSQVQCSQGPPAQPLRRARRRLRWPAWRTSTGPPRTSSATCEATTCGSCWSRAPGDLQSRTCVLHLHLHLSYTCTCTCTCPGTAC